MRKGRMSPGLLIILLIILAALAFFIDQNNLIQAAVDGFWQGYHDSMNS